MRKRQRPEPVVAMRRIDGDGSFTADGERFDLRRRMTRRTPFQVDP